MIEFLSLEKDASVSVLEGMFTSEKQGPPQSNWMPRFQKKVIFHLFMYKKEMLVLDRTNEYSFLCLEKKVLVLD